MEDLLFTVPEVAAILKTNTDYVHKLRRAGLLQFMKIGRFKCRKATLEAFLAKYDGFNITDPDNIKKIEEGEGEEEE